MGEFDIANKSDREIRLCHTRAFVADLFAAHPRSPDMSRRWSDIAREWRDLARLQERTAASYRKIEQMLDDLRHLQP